MYSFIYNVTAWCIFLIFVVYLFYKWSCMKHDYFTKRNILHDKPVLFFGSLKNIILQRQSFAAIICEQYAKYKTKSFFGIFFFRMPVIVITDLALIRSLTVTDFDCFPNHSSYIADNSILKLSLTMMKNEKWWKMRSTLAPVFDTRNVRRMFYHIEECCTTAIDSLKHGRDAKSTFEVDLNDYFRRFALDAVVSLAIGIKPNSLSSKSSEFHKKAMNMIKVTPVLLFKLLLYGNIPRLMKFLRIPFVDNGFMKYFYSLVYETIEFRQKHNIQHYDMIQLLMQSKHNSNSPVSDEVIAQCLIVVFGGLTKITDQLSCVVLELAVNPHVQDKVVEEIRRVQALKNIKKLTLDILNSLNYLDMVVYETLRKWPNQGVLERECAKPYRFYDGSNEHWVDVKPGDIIWVPIIGLHKDPIYFPEPERFCPERFSDDKRGFIRPYSFLPFGIGHRSCLGAKLAITLIKAAIYSLLSEFIFEPENEGMTQVRQSNKTYFVQPDSYKVRMRSRPKVENSERLP